MSALLLGSIVAATVSILSACTVLMPGDNYKGPLPPATPTPAPLESQLRADVQVLAGDIGERNLIHPRQLRAAADYIAAELSKTGAIVRWQTYTTRAPATPDRPAQDFPVSNLAIELPGDQSPAQIILIGAHYDSVNNRAAHSPGANDNASGVAAVLALARRFAGSTHRRTIRFAFFANEEPPYFWTDQMGSLVYARAARRNNDDIVAMLSIETIGSFSDAPNSQDYPPLVGLAYPSTGNFIAFVGMSGASPLVQRCVATFRAARTIAAEGAALPTLVPRVGSSDHWSFWKQGYPALMVTDTAPYRYKHYHKPTDTPDKLNYPAMAGVVEGLARVVADLADAPDLSSLTSSSPDSASPDSPPAPRP